MRAWVGWGLFVFGIPLTLFGFIALGFAGFLGTPAALLLVRKRPGMHRAMPVALGVWAFLLALGLVGGGLTVGSAAGPVFSEGGPGTPLGGLLAAMVLQSLTPGSVALALTDTGWTRRFAWGSVGASLLSLASWPSDAARVNVTLSFLALALAWLLLVAALAVLVWRPRPPPIVFGPPPPVGSRARGS